MSARFEQLDFGRATPATARVLLQRKADAALKPITAQQPCDIGLFSDEPSQTDLVVLANQARKL